MKERRGHWYLLTGLILGIAIGLLASIYAIPVQYINTEPHALNSKDRDNYRALIARAYLVEADNGRALARLALLRDANPADALVAQAQKRMAARRWKEARELFAQASRQDPQNSVARFGLAGDFVHEFDADEITAGTLLTEGKLSRDGGQTWSGTPAQFGNGAEQLRDGSVLGLDYRCTPIEGKTGWYEMARYFSPDGQRFDQDRAEMFAPEAKAAMGHAPHVGPLFMRSILQRADGSLVALMGGWFKSDTALCPYGRGRPYSRTYVCESADGGKTWRYLSTIGYEQIGSEGFNEGSMKRLPDGTWLAICRQDGGNGNYTFTNLAGNYTIYVNQPEFFGRAKVVRNVQLIDGQTVTVGTSRVNYEPDYNIWSIGATYNLSRGTNLYASYASGDANGALVGNSFNATQFAVGVRHLF